MSATKSVTPKPGILDGIGTPTEQWEEGYFKNLYADNFDPGPVAVPLIIGALSSTSIDPALVIARALTGSGNGHAFVDQSLINKSGTIGYNSFDSFPEVTGSNPYDHIAGFQARPNYKSSGAINRLTGFQSFPTVDAGAGLVGRVTHFEARNYSNGGPATAQYALYIEALTSATSNYGIHFLNEPNAGSVSSAAGANITFKAGGGIGSTGGIVQFERTGAGSGYPTTRYSQIRLTNLNTANNNYCGLAFGSLDLAGAEINGAEIGGVFTSHATGAASCDFVIINSDAGTKTEKVRVTSAGYVGIGTDAPTSRLHAVDNRGTATGLIAGQFERGNASGYSTLRLNTIRLLNPDTSDGNYAGASFCTKSLNGTVEIGADIGVEFLSHVNGAVTGDFVILTSNAGTVAERFRITGAGGVTIPKTITAPATTGAQTINKPHGSVNFAAGATTLVVTNSLVSANSTVIPVVYGADATATSCRVTKAAGSFTLTLNAAATAETAVGFFVLN